MEVSFDIKNLPLGHIYTFFAIIIGFVIQSCILSWKLGSLFSKYRMRFEAVEKDISEMKQDIKTENRKFFSLDAYIRGLMACLSNYDDKLRVCLRDWIDTKSEADE